MTLSLTVNETLKIEHLIILNGSKLRAPNRLHLSPFCTFSRQSGLSFSFSGVIIVLN